MLGTDFRVSSQFPFNRFGHDCPLRATSLMIQRNSDFSNPRGKRKLAREIWDKLQWIQGKQVLVRDLDIGRFKKPKVPRNWNSIVLYLIIRLCLFFLEGSPADRCRAVQWNVLYLWHAVWARALRAALSKRNRQGNTLVKLGYVVEESRDFCLIIQSGCRSAGLPRSLFRCLILQLELREPDQLRFNH